MEIYEIIMLVCCILCAISSVAVLFVVLGQKKTPIDKRVIKEAVDESLSGSFKMVLDSIERTNSSFIKEINEKLSSIEKSTKDFNEKNTNNYIELIEKLNASLSKMSEAVREENEKAIKNLNEKFDSFSKNMTEKYALIGQGVDKSLKDLRRENEEKLSAIQATVDEKLQKTLDERLKTSFENVVSQIGNVNKAIGEIKSIASGVDSLRNVLTNVKAKGIVGEVVLGNIISDVLTPNQYEENVATKKGSDDVVEFAIKMPTSQDGDFVYLPVDSKFPLEPYNKLKESMEKGDKQAIDSSRKELRTRIVGCAKDISSKYIDVPHTTAFAVMFLPTEGLYIEVIESGLFEELQRKYKINVVGPSTLFAFLNSLRFGFDSLAIQKHSNKVFTLLEAIKTEFGTFAKTLSSAKKKVDQASRELDVLTTKKADKMEKKLRDISVITLGEAENILEIESDNEGEEE
ncbi:MAG: DNA recombination protein RmuC [Clostridia bacterium]|nr:DNA recombination protein RmuC [Clostridia bacterium]